MSSDALFQLGIVSVCLNGSQTDILPSRPSVTARYPLRKPARSATAAMRRSARRGMKSDLPPPTCPDPIRRNPSLPERQRHS